MNKLQKLAFSHPWSNGSVRCEPAVQQLPDGLAIGLSLNY
jgi:hypothetical protein